MWHFSNLRFHSNTLMLYHTRVNWIWEVWGQEENPWMYIETLTYPFDRKYLRHCVKSVRIRSYSGPNFPALGLNKERYGVYLRIQSECWKMQTRITPNVDTFYAARTNDSNFISKKLSTTFICTLRLSYGYRSSHHRCSVRKDVLRSFEKLTEKHLCQSLFLIKLQA